MLVHRGLDRARRGRSGGCAGGPAGVRPGGGAPPRALVGRGAHDRLAVLDLRRDHEPRAAAAAPGAGPRAVDPGPRAVAPHRARARARHAGWPGTRRSGCDLRLLRQRALRRHAGAARAGCGAGAPTSTGRCATRSCSSTCSRFVVFWLYPGGPAADARGVHRRGGRDARDRLLAHRRAGLARQRARRDAVAAHRLGRVVHARDLDGLARALGARARGAVPVRDRASRCSRPATTSCWTCSVGFWCSCSRR